MDKGKVDDIINRENMSLNNDDDKLLDGRLDSQPWKNWTERDLDIITT